MKTKMKIKTKIHKAKQELEMKCLGAHPRRHVPSRPRSSATDHWVRRNRETTGRLQVRLLLPFFLFFQETVLMLTRPKMV